MVNITPIATANPACVDGTIELFGSGGDTYSWSGPNSFTSSSSNPTIAGANPAIHDGRYFVTVTNAAGCSDTTSVVVAVAASP